MAERCNPDTVGDGGGPGHPVASGPRRVVALRTLSRPQPAAGRGWAGNPGESTGGWIPDPPRGSSASALAESVFPLAAELPFEPDPEAAAFLNAPRRPLGFHVAPFGTPPFGNPPGAVDRSVYGGPTGSGAAEDRERPQWGSAYPAGA